MRESTLLITELKDIVTVVKLMAVCKVGSARKRRHPPRGHHVFWVTKLVSQNVHVAWARH